MNTWANDNSSPQKKQRISFTDDNSSKIVGPLKKSTYFLHWRIIVNQKSKLTWLCDKKKTTYILHRRDLINLVGPPKKSTNFLLWRDLVHQKSKLSWLYGKKKHNVFPSLTRSRSISSVPQKSQRISFTDDISSHRKVIWPDFLMSTNLPCVRISEFSVSVRYRTLSL